MATGLSGLEEIQERWLALFEELRREGGARRSAIAAPFLSAPPPHYDARRRCGVLYVGKATHGCWRRSSFLNRRSREERLEASRTFLRDVQCGHYGSAFWRFAAQLSARVAEVRGEPLKPLDNLIWTNIAKIGRSEGNPEGWQLKRQSCLAVETLRLEIAAYRPALVVFVTGNYATELIYEAIAPRGEPPWHREPDDTLWLPAAPAAPPVLWTDHPQAKARARIEAWLSIGENLVRDAGPSITPPAPPPRRRPPSRRRP